MELFIQVCEGVQHAHQKAIIHRDLKPSNILITEVDGRPAPRIIDFGVAKATSQPVDEATVFTQFGAPIGTIGYMSPEQAGSGGEDIDTRSDVYSLGAVLYELLVGALPLDVKKLATDEALRRLRNRIRPRPAPGCACWQAIPRRQRKTVLLICLHSPGNSRAIPMQSFSKRSRETAGAVMRRFPNWLQTLSAICTTSPCRPMRPVEPIARASTSGGIA
jgi:serine/threonine protein kinase